MLSDGVHYVTAMLTSTLNKFVADDSVKKFSVIRLKDYFQNDVNGRKYVCPTPKPGRSRTRILAPQTFRTPPIRAPQIFTSQCVARRKKRPRRTNPNPFFPPFHHQDHHHPRHGAPVLRHGCQRPARFRGERGEQRRRQRQRNERDW